MTWGAVAVAGATYLTEKERIAAEERAASKNRRLSREELAEERRQFETETGIGEQRYGFEALRADELSTSRRAREDEINQRLREQFEGLRTENIARLDPYAQAGTAALSEQQALLGLGSPEEQQAAMSRFTESPGQRFLRERQEKALLRNQAAIGGLGGGNIRTALQEQAFGRSQTDLQNQIDRLSGLSGQGFAAARGQGVEQGFGPAYVQTGPDLGVGTTRYTPYEAPPPPPPEQPPYQRPQGGGAQGPGTPQQQKQEGETARERQREQREQREQRQQRQQNRETSQRTGRGGY